MSPTVTQTRPCPKCHREAHLTGWTPPAGYDPHLREYLCPKCGNRSYIIGGEKTYQTEALPIEES